MFSEKIISQSKECRVEARRADIFSFLIDPRNTPKWLPEISYVSHRPSGEISTGTQVLCRVRAFGISRDTSFEFIDFKPPHKFTTGGVSDAIEYQSEFSLTDLSNNLETLLKWKIEVRLPFFFSLGNQLIASTLSRDMDRGLKEMQAIASSL
jgi:carbon monoxide dehydrogenase subunit G